MNKRLVLHDMKTDDFEKIGFSVTTDDTLFSAEPMIEPCVGCFGCWTITPGTCVIDDRGKGFASLIAGHDELVVISRMVSGGLSPPVKAVLDRSIGYVLPFFRLVKGEMHHSRRNKKKLLLRYLFYGENISQKEREIAAGLIAANALNFAVGKSILEFSHPLDKDIEVRR